MSTRREEILRELGLTPVWRLRERAPAAATEEPPPAMSAPQRPAQAATKPQSAHAPRAAPKAAAASPPLADSLDPRAAGIARMEWPQLKEAVAGCTACPLHKARNKTVFGVGDENAEWLFVGEGPGAEEDAKGEPFVGQAGKLLDNMLAAIGLKRGENAYIANVVKCRPPANRNPEPLEAAQCEPYLHRQIALIRPRLIVALGKVAAVNLLRREASIASLRGKVLEYRGTPLIVTYHPAYLLRSLPDKSKAWEDLCFAVETMRGLQNAVTGTT